MFLLKAKRALAVFCVFAIVVLSAFSACPLTAQANEGAVEVCIVYDNSGSTFFDQTWSRYKYAIEVFASMFDYEGGNSIYIFPMNPVTLDGRESSASTEPIRIASYADIAKITNMCTVHPANTPYRVVEEAYSKLYSSDATDKRLLIFTDGAFDEFAMDGGTSLQDELDMMLRASDIKIYYFGSGLCESVKPNEKEGLYVSIMEGTVDALALMGELMGVCGDVFGRATLYSTEENVVTLQISDQIEKLIVFADGKHSNVLSLSGADGKIIQCAYDTGSHTYSTIGQLGVASNFYDTDLNSYITVYKDCQPGNYTLACENSTMVYVYAQYGRAITGTGTESSKEDSRVFSSVADLNSKQESEAIGTSGFDNSAIVVVALAVVVALVVIIACLAMKTPKKYQIFISYRRDGGDALAGRLADRLERLGYKTFYDVESMRAGEFNEQIYKAIEESSDFLLVLPPNALDRCVDEKDWVRLELAYALRMRKNVVPIMMRGFEFPENLPADIDNVRNMQGIVPSMTYFDDDVRHIEDYLSCKKKRWIKR